MEQFFVLALVIKKLFINSSSSFKSLIWDVLRYHCTSNDFPFLNKNLCKAYHYLRTHYIMCYFVIFNEFL